MNRKQYNEYARLNGGFMHADDPRLLTAMRKIARMGIRASAKRNLAETKTEGYYHDLSTL